MSFSYHIGHLFCNHEGYVDKVAVWTFALFFVTFILALIGVLQLKKLNKTGSADFASKLIEGFFTEDTRNLVVLLFNSAIEYLVLEIKNSEGKVIDELPYFKIKEKVLRQLKKAGLICIPEWRKGYNACEIDDLLLGYLEDVGRLERTNQIDFETARGTLGYYILEFLNENNKEVNSYLNHPDLKGCYYNLRYIYSQLVSYEQVKKKGYWAKLLWPFIHWRNKIKKKDS